MYTTYGINNVKNGNIEGALDGDPEIGNLASSNVIGRAKFSIPLLGFIAHFVQNPPGKYLVLIGCVMLIFMTFFANGPSDDETQPESTGAECDVKKKNDEGAPESPTDEKCDKTTDNDN